MADRCAGSGTLIRTAAVAALAALMLACSPQSTAEPASSATDPVQATGEAVHPVSGLEVIDLQVISGDETHDFRVELAQSPAEQARGLMFRTEMGPNEGMLFPSKAPDRRSFWMKNTPMSLDIIFIGTDGRITNIAANTEPYSLTPSVSTGFAIAVLELVGGRAAELGIEPGDQVVWTIEE